MFIEKYETCAWKHFIVYIFAHYDVNWRSDEIHRYRRIRAFAFIFNKFPVISRESDRTMFVPWQTLPRFLRESFDFDRYQGRSFFSTSSFLTNAYESTVQQSITTIIINR